MIFSCHSNMNFSLAIHLDWHEGNSTDEILVMFEILINLQNAFLKQVPV